MSRTVRALLALLLSAGPYAAEAGDLRVLTAVRNGDADALRMLVRQRVDVNATEADGTSALHLAAERDDLAVARVLVGAGARAGAANRFGATPLALAALNGSARMLALLLEAGADPNATLPGGETALMTAARTGRVDAMDVLLARGATVNAREDARGQTALMWAAAEGNAAAVTRLLKAGADLRARAHGPDAEPGAKPKRIDALTPLLFAVRSGRLDAVAALLDGGADVNEAAPDGSSALSVACLNQHWELGALLLARGADPNAAAQGWTPLHLVVKARTPELGRFPRPETTGRISAIELARRLIARGANVNARATKEINDGYRHRVTWIGTTPFFVAAKGVDHQMMRLLVGAGSDPLLANADGTTPLMAASGVEMFYSGEDDGTDEDSLQAVTLALSLGGDVTAVSRKGETALHGAAKRGYVPLVRLLIDRGARLDAKNDKGWTPLTVALGYEKGNPINLFQAERATLDAAALLMDVMAARGLPIDENTDALVKLRAFKEKR